MNMDQLTSLFETKHLSIDRKEILDNYTTSVPCKICQ